MMRESRTSFRLRRGPGADRWMRSRTVKPFGVSRLEKFVFAFRASEAFSREIKALRSNGAWAIKDPSLSKALIGARRTDRKSTRLNSSHTVISYAVFCLKKKKQKESTTRITTNTSLMT